MEQAGRVGGYWGDDVARQIVSDFWRRHQPVLQGSRGAGQGPKRPRAGVNVRQQIAAVLLPAESSREVGEPDHSWKYLSQAMQRGGDHGLTEMDSHELTTPQDCSRDVEDLVDCTKAAAVEREMKVVGAQKADAERLRNVVLEEKANAQAELDKVMGNHLDKIQTMNEAHEAALAQEKGEHEALLAGEQRKSVCKKCLNRRTDVVVMPCKHFDYCLLCLAEHRLQQDRCPSCRGPIHGIVGCPLGLL